MAKNATQHGAEKSALLAELLGPEQAAALRLSTGKSEGSANSIDPKLASWHRNRLIERFREKGLLPGSERPQEKDAPPVHTGQAADKPSAGKPKPQGNGSGMMARLASHIEPDRLCDEHPAVVAVLLQSQSAKMRSEVLRRLPGGQARAVMRLLRANAGTGGAESKVNRDAAS